MFQVYFPFKYAQGSSSIFKYRWPPCLQFKRYNLNATFYNLSAKYIRIWYDLLLWHGIFLLQSLMYVLFKMSMNVTTTRTNVTVMRRAKIPKAHTIVLVTMDMKGMGSIVLVSSNSLSIVSKASKLVVRSLSVFITFYA